MGEALISADNHWLLLTVVTSAAALSIYLEKRYKWASVISGAVIALIFALLLSNFNIIPTDAPVYDVVWGYVVPLSIPLLLFKTNIRNVWKESSRMLGIFIIGAFGTMLGAALGYVLLADKIPHLAEVAGMMTGSYIGGGVNFVALSDAFGTPGEIVSATVVADNLTMALYILMLTAIPTLNFFRRNYKTPHIDKAEAGYKKEVSKDENERMTLEDIGISFAVAFAIVTFSNMIGEFFTGVIPTGGTLGYMFNMLLGSQYVWITTLSMILATFFPSFTENVQGPEKLGTYLIYLFFVVIGVPASIPLILQNAPLLLVFTLIMVLVNMTVMFFFGRLFNFTLEEIILASNANIGGPTTAVAMGISQGWYDLTAPTMLVGTFGYVIGTYAGIIIGNFFI